MDSVFYSHSGLAEASIDHELLMRWLRAFLFTLVVEVPIFVVLVRGAVPAWRAAIAGAAGTFLTHPLLIFVWRPFCQRHGFSYEEYIISGELTVGVIESLTFYALARPIRLTRAIACSFIANAASYGGGNLMRWLGWWH